MINKELELTLSESTILDDLATNLNLENLSDNSNISKLANTFLAEQRNYSTATENSIRNGFISTMSDDLLEEFASSFGLYRKTFSKIRLRPIEEVAELYVDLDTSFKKNSYNITPFKKGDTLYSDDTITVTAVQDIVIDNISDHIYPFLDITFNSSNSDSSNATTITEGSEFYIQTEDETLSTIIPNYYLVFNYDVGLSIVEENIEDFRLRVYEASYLSGLNTNSLIASIVKEVPLISFIETDQEEGRAISTIYPYTDTLVETGTDALISSIIVPMVASSLSNKITINNGLVDVVEPTPLYVIVDIIEEKNLPTESTIESIIKEFNILHKNSKTVTYSYLVEYFCSKFDLETYDFTISFISNYLSEDALRLDEFTNISIPVGRFLNLLAIEVAV